MQSKQIKKLLQSFCLDGERIKITAGDIDWLIKTGLSPIAAGYAAFDSEDDPGNKALGANNLNSKLWYQLQLNATKEIVSKFAEKGIAVTLLKGISVSEELYKTSPHRVMRDIDLLVDEEDLEQAEEILPTLGFEQTSTYSSEFYETLHHTMPWQHRKYKIWIEIHKKLFPNTSACCQAEIFTLNIIHSEKHKGDFHGMDVFYLSKEFQLVYIATHWAEKFKHIGGAFGLLDVALLINNYSEELDWDKIIAWSNIRYVSEYVYLVLQYLIRNQFLKSNIKPETQAKLLSHTQDKVSVWILNKMIDWYIIEGRSFGRMLSINNVAIIWRHLLEPGNPFKRIILIPVAIVFPRKSKKRFNLIFQFSRVMTMLTGSKD